MTSKTLKLATLISTFFGAGNLRPAPGTWGTLFALPLIWVVAQGGIFVYMGFTALLLPISIAAAHAYETSKGGHDYSEIVIDEVVGIFVTMTWLPMTWQSFVFSFFLFRLLDIWKPFPIGYLDKKVQGGVGVVLDDLVAGIFANIILQYVYTKTTWLGIQGIVIQ